MISYEVWSLLGGLAMFVVSYFFVSFFWWVDPTSHGFPFFPKKKSPYISLGGLVSYFFVFFWWVDPTSHGFPFSPKKIPYISLIFPRVVWCPFLGADPGQL